MAPNHEIFHHPLEVDLTFEDRPTPEGYRRWPGGEALGPTLKVWKVQEKSYPEIDPGLVSDPYGFADSPDAEVIASGINSKGPESVALGRHGNFFLWGFSARPSDMTAAGRRCFLNVICYIKKFDGTRPLVRERSPGRRWALFYAGYMKRRPTGEFARRMFPAALRKRFGTDGASYVKYYRENLEYLVPAKRGGFVVDPDVKRLGLSNRKVALLERAVAMLEAGTEEALARRLLARYTTESFREARQWRAWLEKHRERLYFSDVGGYKFRVVPAGYPVGSARPSGG